MKHPAAIAWDNWINDADNEFAAKANLTPHRVNDQYMKNRLWHAFMAGWEAGQNKPSHQR